MAVSKLSGSQFLVPLARRLQLVERVQSSPAEMLAESENLRSEIDCGFVFLYRLSPSVIATVLVEEKNGKPLGWRYMQ